MLKTFGRKRSLLTSGNVGSIEGRAMEDSVHIYGLVRFVTGFLGRGEEAKKNQEAVNTDIFNALDGNVKREKPRTLIPCPFYVAFGSQ